MPSSIGKRVLEALSKQINDEMIIAYTFLSMVAVFSDMGLNGCSKWARVQYDGTTRRALKITDYILLRGAPVKLLPIPAPKRDWRAPLHMFEEVVRIEQRNSSNCTTLVETAVADKDYATQHFLMYFVNDQMKRDAFATYALDRIRKMQSTDVGVLLFDKELLEHTEKL